MIYESTCGIAEKLFVNVWGRRGPGDGAENPRGWHLAKDSETSNVCICLRAVRPPEQGSEQCNCYGVACLAAGCGRRIGAAEGP